MDEKKQIEDMAHNLCLNELDCEDCERNGVCLAYGTSTIIYNAGYRKIPEGAVVFTREEYDALIAEQKRMRNAFERIPCGYSLTDETRKDTVKEMLKRFENAFGYCEKEESFSKSVILECIEVVAHAMMREAEE